MTSCRASVAAWAVAALNWRSRLVTWVGGSDSRQRSSPAGSFFLSGRHGQVNLPEPAWCMKEMQSKPIGSTSSTTPAKESVDSTLKVMYKTLLSKFLISIQNFNAMFTILTWIPFVIVHDRHPWSSRYNLTFNIFNLPTKFCSIKSSWNSPFAYSRPSGWLCWRNRLECVQSANQEW